MTLWGKCRWSPGYFIHSDFLLFLSQCTWCCLMAESCCLMFAEKKALGDGSFEDSAFKIDYVPFCKKGFDPEKLQRLLEEKEPKEPGETLTCWWTVCIAPFSLQKNTVKLVFKACKRDHVQPLLQFGNANILPNTGHQKHYIQKQISIVYISFFIV